MTSYFRPSRWEPRYADDPASIGRKFVIVIGIDLVTTGQRWGAFNVEMAKSWVDHLTQKARKWPVTYFIPSGSIHFLIFSAACKVFGFFSWLSLFFTQAFIACKRKKQFLSKTLLFQFLSLLMRNDIWRTLWNRSMSIAIWVADREAHKQIWSPYRGPGHVAGSVPPRYDSAFSNICHYASFGEPKSVI